MSQDTRYTIGTEVLCSDGVCGHLKQVVIDPVARVLRHLIVEPRHRQGLGRLVPVEQVASVDKAIHLSCTTKEFEALPFAEESRFLSATGTDLDYGPGEAYVMPYFALDYSAGPLGGIAAADGAPHIVSYDRIPEHEVEVRRGDPVQASDGPIGQVRGLVVDPGDHHVTHLLLEEGHLFGRKEVAIPITAVTSVDDEGAHLKLTRDQVRDLPPVGIDHS
jgi:sporulation protein YlmC with PRC-barrel domain